MNNPKTIEAIKVLYRGDIDDAPHQEPLIGDNWFKDVQGARHAVYSLQDGGVRHLKHQAVYDLIRALCLQEPTSDEHPLHVGWLDNREIRAINKPHGGIAACPFCDQAHWGGNNCGANIIGSHGHTAFWIGKTHPPAPVKEPDEFEKELLAQIKRNEDYPIVSAELSATLTAYREIKQGAH